MTARQWHEWQIYMGLAPFAEERADYRTAWIVQTLINLNLDRKKKPKGFTLDDIMNEVRFGDREEILPPGPTRRQSSKEQFDILKKWFNVDALQAMAERKKNRKQVPAPPVRRSRRG